MLRITIPRREFFDEANSKFVYGEEVFLELEHSLSSLSKWESKWKKPFLSNKDDKTKEEILDYLKIMTLNEVDDSVYDTLPPEALKQIEEYLQDPMTATTFSDNNGPPSREIQTAEIIYYWMIELGIPLEAEHWPLQKLTTLIRVCSIKKGPEKKMSKREVYNRNRELNDARRAKTNSKG